MHAQPLIAPLPPATHSKRETRSQRYMPCKLYLIGSSFLSHVTDAVHLDSNRPKSKGQKAHSNGQNKFQDPSSPLLLPVIASWQCAMENFDVMTAQFVYNIINPTDLGYIFPEPAMLLCMQTVERWETYFKTWLKYLSALI